VFKNSFLISGLLRRKRLAMTVRHISGLLRRKRLAMTHLS